MDNLPIFPIPDETLTCFERPLCATVKYFDRGYNMMFISSWHFANNFLKDYKSAKDIPTMMSILQNIQEYIGIRTNIFDKGDLSSFFNIVQNELKNKRPIMIYMDSYWCPWYPSYKTSHIHHYILIIGNDLEKEVFYCLDREKDGHIKELPYSDYKKGRGEYIVFKKDPLPKIDFKKLSSLFVNYLNHIGQTAMLKDIDEFADILENSFDIQEETRNYHDIKVAPIYTWLKGISNSRTKFCYALSELKSIYPSFDYEYYHKQFHALSDDWRKIILLLIKAISDETPQKTYYYASETARKIKVKELKLLKELDKDIRLL